MFSFSHSRMPQLRGILSFQLFNCSFRSKGFNQQCQPVQHTLIPYKRSVSLALSLPGYLDTLCLTVSLNVESCSILRLFFSNQQSVSSFIHPYLFTLKKKSWLFLLSSFVLKRELTTQQQQQHNYFSRLSSDYNDHVVKRQTLRTRL